MEDAEENGRLGFRERALAFLSLLRRSTSRRALPRLLPLLAVLFVSSLFVKAWSGKGWVPVGRIESLERDGIIYSNDAGAFIVDGDSGPLALSEKSPHLGDRVVFCRSSGLFEAIGHGEKFDRDGDYYGGPAPRGMDRLELRVEGSAILVNPLVVIDGPPRPLAGERPERVDEPIGPFCSRLQVDSRGILDG